MNNKELISMWLEILSEPLTMIDIVEELSKRKGHQVNYNWTIKQVTALIESGQVRRFENGPDRPTYQSCTKVDHVKCSRVSEVQVFG